MLYIHAFIQTDSEPATHQFIRKCGVIMILLFVFLVIIVCLGQANLVLGVLTVLMPVMVPFLMLKQLDRQILIMKRAIIMELPIFLNKMTLLVNAGETIQRAIVRCSVKYETEHDHPFAREMQLISKQLSNLYPLAQVLDECSRRCGVQEVSVFTTTVLMNHKRGGEEFVASLRQLSHELWEKRKKYGEGVR